MVGVLDPAEATGLAARLRAGRMWSVYGRHGMALYGSPTFTGWAGDRAFALLTGEANLDLNICNLQPGAGAADTRELLAVVDRVGAPTVIPVSTRALGESGAVLRDAGFRPLEPEVAMWRAPGPVEPRPIPFDVRPAASMADIAAVSRVIAEAHGTAPDLVERVFNLDAWRAGEVRCYVAWDGGGAASAGWFTTGEGYVGVWEMMTSPRHRRRGAGRAVLQAG